MSRVFLGIRIPKELIQKIAKVQEGLKKENFDVKWVEPENLHFNLKFFGSKTSDEIKKINEKIKKVLKEQSPFKIKIKGGGAFPSENYARVIWLGIAESPELDRLVEELEEAFSEIGIEKEKRKFRAHLTLGRVRSAKNKEKLAKKVEELREISIGEFEVDELVLIESKLSPKSPTYVDLEKFKFEE